MRRKNSTICIYISLNVKASRKANLFYGVVSVLGAAPTVAGTLQLTFVTPRREVRISKQESSKPKGIKSKHILSVFTSKLNLRSPKCPKSFRFLQRFLQRHNQNEKKRSHSIRSTESLQKGTSFDKQRICLMVFFTCCLICVILQQ